MKLFLTSAYPYCATTNFGPQWLVDKAAPADLALLTGDPAEAGCILFVENHPGDDPYYLQVLRSPLYRQFRNKCVLYHDADRTVTPLPTIAPSVARWQVGRGTKKSAHYIARLCENETLNAATPDWSADREYLYSFSGSSRTHAVRRQLLAQPHRGAHLADTGELRAWEMTPTQKLAYETEYLRVASQSSFILCPRGIGSSTYRLFETLQLGRAPVIIADDWVEIEGIDWQAFSIRIPEREIAGLHDLLQQRRPEAVAMGRMARQVWEQHFSPAASLRTLAAMAGALLGQGYRRRDWLADQRQFLTPFHLRGLARQLRRGLWAR